MSIESIVMIIGFAGLGALLWLRRPSTSTESEQEAHLREKIEDLKSALLKEKSEKDELSGKGKEMYDRFKSLESDYKALGKEADILKAQKAKYEAELDQRAKKHEDLINKLDTSNKALEEEKLRIRREDEERQAELEAERDRLWAEHETDVIAQLKSLCKNPQLNFRTFENTNLPEGFSGKLKPDFMVEFLEQYVIFDAKVSKANNLSVYIKDQVKKTAQKVKGNEMIYPTLFLVVPTHALAELKETHFYEEGFTFFIVSPEALGPILSSLKKIETYEFAEALDPQERENIVDLIAQFMFHINSRNAIDFKLMEHGFETMEKANALGEDLIKEIAVKKAKMRALNFNTADVKKLIDSPQALADKVMDSISPKAKISSNDLQSAEEALGKNK